MANQTRGNAIEHAPQNEAATRCNEYTRFLVVGCSPLGERPQRSALNLDALAVSGIAPTDHFINEAAIGGEVFEVA